MLNDAFYSPKLTTRKVIFARYCWDHIEAQMMYLCTLIDVGKPIRNSTHTIQGVTLCQRMPIKDLSRSRLRAD